MKTAMTSKFSKRAVRWLALLLGLILLPLSLFACGEPEDEILINRARELLPLALEMDSLFYVEGVPVDEEEGVSKGYYSADAEALKALGFTSVADMKARMREIWTENYCARFETSAVFSAVYGAGGIESYAYVYDSYDLDGNFTGVKVSAAGIPLQMDRVVYDPDSLCVTWKSRKSATLTVSAAVTNGAGEYQERERSLTLSLDTDGEWRFDANTCMKYKYDQYGEARTVLPEIPTKEKQYGIQ